MDQRAGEEPQTRRASRPAGTWRVGQIGGIDVLVRSSWLLVAALISVSLAPEVQAREPGLGGLAYVAGHAFAGLLYLSVRRHEAAQAEPADRLQPLLDVVAGGLLAAVGF